MTLIDLPWRYAKVANRQQATRAWGNGGPIPHEAIGLNWEPVATDDFTTLVPKAMAGDDHARFTLQVAGGIALVADKVLMSNTGSAFDSGQAPFRSNVNDVVAELGRASNEAGLWQLARAANAFRADRRASNSFTRQEVLRTPPGPDNYTVPQVKRSRPSELVLDNAQQPVALTPFELLYTSNPQRAEDEKAKKDKTTKQPKPAETTAAKVRRLRASLAQQVRGSQEDLRALIALGADPTVQPVLGDHELWQGLMSAVQEIMGQLYVAQPPAPSLIDFDEDEPEELDDFDEDAAEGNVE
ncbi:hypothetical protein [Kineosporia sp. NBRC 101731]|uniref:hypothetical protein n=1 Tax=Kineosporia sp. NBRC 101731 TaxID=3032199 RepID=UPI0024A239A1|nr:hypothetical protein [Kineosporia sp. NBRC 101731]GLY31506.1 hypothetical protein Kisp02_48710 [Kineosporia sp. NBRC 101731]